MVEFVFMLPIMLILIWGVVEVSRAWLMVGMVAEATRNGARTGAVTPTTAGDVFDSAPAYAAIDAMLNATGLSAGATRSVTCTTPCRPDSQVQATVTVTFSSALLPWITPVNIRETTTMRRE